MGNIRYPNLSDLAHTIWQWCEARGLFFYATYIPSAENKEADSASRMLLSETEWELSNTVFNRIVSSFGQPNIDVFATIHNRQCERYASWLGDSSCFTVDAFTLHWKSFKFYAFPPFSLIPETLQKIIKDEATAILVVTSPVEEHYPGCRAIIREALERRDIPHLSTDICLASVSDSTYKLYNVGLKSWWSFCKKGNADVFSNQITLVLKFLTHHFELGASYGSLNSYRSALGQILDPHLAQDYRMERFFKGIYNLRPNCPNTPIHGTQNWTLIS
nr:unnamed protein product [Callosobruchus chinensis]